MIQKKIIINNLAINYYVSEGFNENGPLVYLHGWGSEVRHFKNILEKCNNFIALDLPGFGGSSMPDGDWAVDDYANFFEKFLEKLEINNPILAGHSFGGSVIIKYLSKGRVAQKAILIDAAGIRRKTLKTIVFKILAIGGKALFFMPILRKFKDKVRQSYSIMIGATDYLHAGQLRESFRKIINEDLSENLKNINTDTVLIWGEKDYSVTPVKDGKQMNKLIKNSRIFMIKNAGHYPFLDNEKDFTEVFLKEIRC